MPRCRPESQLRLGREAGVLAGAQGSQVYLGAIVAVRMRLLPIQGTQVYSGAAAMIEIHETLPRQGGIGCIRARRRSSRYTFMRVWSTQVYSGVAGDTEIHETPA
jgi:hypothetical protein